MIGCLKKSLKCLGITFVLVVFPLLIAYMYFNCCSFDHIHEIENDGGKYIILQDGRYLEYFEAGNPEKQIVIGLPGFGATGKFFSTLQNKKVLDNFFFLGISLPGFGGSSRKVDKGLNETPSDVKELLKYLGREEEEIIIVGTSHGGLNANAFACGNDHGLAVKQVQFLCPSAPAQYAPPAGEEDLTFEEVSSFKRRIIIHLISLLVYNLPKLFPTVLIENNEGMADCMNMQQRDIDLLVNETIRAGKFSTFGFYDNIKSMFQPYDVKCTEEEKKKSFFFAFGGKDLVCGEKHQQFYHDRYEITEKNSVVYAEEGHCHCVRHFEEEFLQGVSLLKN